MEELVKTTEKKEIEEEFSLKNYFVPFTTAKAVTWIVFIGVIVYANILINGFVWDDKSYILMNQQVHTINIPLLFNKNSFNITGQYRPITALFFATLYSLFTTQAFFYHFIQISIHIANALLVFFLFKRFFSRNISFFLSLVFLIHPIQVESVSYIAASDNPLYFLFGISGLLMGTSEALNKKRILVISILLLLSLLTKETGILFFVMIFIYRIIFKKGSIRHFFIGGIISLGIYLLLRCGFASIYLYKLQLIPIASLTFAGRMSTVPAIIFYYLKTFFFPASLSIEQQWVVTKLDMNHFYLPLIIDCFFFLLIFSGIYFLRKYKKQLQIYIFFLSWFLSGLLLHIQLFPLDMTVADRWFYFPIVGLLGMIGIALQIKFGKKKRIVFPIIGICILVCLATRTMVRNTNWHDAITLYNHDAQINDNFDIENNLGTEFGYLQDYPQALVHYQKSVAFYPNESNLFNLGYIYELTGNFAKAKEYYIKAMSVPYYSETSHKHYEGNYDRLSVAFLRLNNVKTAKKVLVSGLKDYPDSAELWEDLAITEYKLNNRAGAIAAIEKAQTLSPDPEIKIIEEQIINKKLR